MEPIFLFMKTAKKILLQVNKFYLYLLNIDSENSTKKLDIPDRKRDNSMISLLNKSFKSLKDYENERNDRIRNQARYPHLKSRDVPRLEQFKEELEIEEMNRPFDDMKEVEDESYDEMKEVENEKIGKVDLSKSINSSYGRTVEAKRKEMMKVNVPKPIYITSDSDNIQQKMDVDNHLHDLLIIMEKFMSFLQSENENKIFNDVNYWRFEIKDESYEDLLKDL